MELAGLIISGITALGTLALAIWAAVQARASQETSEANRAMVQANREMVKEMQEARISQERPHIIVDADYSRDPLIELVVRNIGKGPAKNIRFDFSASLDSLGNKDLRELPYFKHGMDFLAPGGEIRATWDVDHVLMPLLEQKGLDEGIRATTHYEAVSGEKYDTLWVINPLLLKGTPSVRTYNISDLAKAVIDISKDLHKAMRFGELRVATKTERKGENNAK